MSRGSICQLVSEATGASVPVSGHSSCSQHPVLWAQSRHSLLLSKLRDGIQRQYKGCRSETIAEHGILSKTRVVDWALDGFSEIETNIPLCCSVIVFLVLVDVLQQNVEIIEVRLEV